MHKILFPILAFILWLLAPIGAMASGKPATREFVHHRTRKAVETYRSSGDSETIARAILEESRRQGFHPFLIMAVIEHESGFRPRMRGRHGEIGLMQIKPDTARWIARRAGIKYSGPLSLEDPVTNIRIGTAYLAFLRSEFPARGYHYLAAYNMGPGNARRLFRRRQAGPGRYASHVIRRYRSFRTEMRRQQMDMA